MTVRDILTDENGKVKEDLTVDNLIVTTDLHNYSHNLRFLIPTAFSIIYLDLLRGVHKGVAFLYKSAPKISNTRY
jgi:hypothetical protein